MNEQDYLLTQLSEEAAEVIKEVSKCLHFGLYGADPLIPGPNNVERVVDELNDLLGTVQLLVDKGILPSGWSSFSKQQRKRTKIKRFMQCSKKLCILQE